MQILKIEETDSTNSWISRRRDELEAPVMVMAEAQTAGRGQRGNVWIAEPGMNLTASALIVPDGVVAAKQFVISEAVALSLADTLSHYGIEAMVKWPNDIYVGDKKIAGILIENSILGQNISHSIIGIGLNVNQTEFGDGAPNPISMASLAGEPFSIQEVAEKLALSLEARLAQMTDSVALHEEYMKRLWRNDGDFYPFIDRTADEKIEALINHVDMDGTLHLMIREGTERKYAFKEVEFVNSFYTD